MARLEELTRGATVKGILPEASVTVVDAKWHGSSVLELTYKDPAGRLGNELLFRDRESGLEVVSAGQALSFTADGALFRLASEASRIRLAYLFDPLLAVHTSLVDPLPHQITAVYEALLPRQPLRFLLADDPGAGKTIMAGLFIKELRARADLSRCLVVCPGSLVEQWQDELQKKFQLPFEILTNDKFESARTGNWFQENPLAICRLDKLSRDPAVQEKLQAADWDLVICDEAHKMSATVFGSEIKYTKRYRLGQVLSDITRHFLLMTATPHNGKEEDFQLFMALLDPDRFEGRFREEHHLRDASDLMRRMVKEDLVKLDGTPLFPERRATTVHYKLSEPEAALYGEVTDYVREQFNRADDLENERRRGTVGFALTILQRRLASSPEAIYQSLVRRRERLEDRLREEKRLQRGAGERLHEPDTPPDFDEEEVEDFEDAPGGELEEAEEVIVDQATAARTIAELEAEIASLKRLESLALRVRASGRDRKWEELSKLLQDTPEMFDATRSRRKLIIFTEHRDTLNYLARRIRDVLGEEPVVVIHGGLPREVRSGVQAAFTNDPEVLVLVATDAAGEGINLQRAHLMVNYDLPWNPNRLEQRFGRIHRIRQTEVCHLWNLVAEETREGEVYLRLLQKLERERETLGGRVFDVLGRAMSGPELRKLLIEAIRYGEEPEVRARLTQKVDRAMDREHLRRLLEERALDANTMDAAHLQKIREDMERAAARRLQPHFIQSFFLEAFRHLGGAAREREPRRFELTHVPGVIRDRDRLLGARETVVARYERITFEKELISLQSKPLAEFVCPGHPLLDATLHLVLERHRSLLKEGAILLDESDPADSLRVLVYLQHAIQDACQKADGSRQVASLQMQFVEIGEDGALRDAGYAPYLTYRPLKEEEESLVAPILEKPFLKQDFEERATRHAVENLVPRHFQEVKTRRETLIERTRGAVRERLTREINYWYHRAEELKVEERAGKTPKLNSKKATERAQELERRLQRRIAELEEESRLSPTPPVVLGAALVVPQGLLLRLKGQAPEEIDSFARETRRVEALAMAAVLEAERRLGFEPRDVSREKRGYDIESRIPGTGRLRFIEVKGRVPRADTVTVTKNEILTALNKPEDFILALVEVEGERARTPRYVRRPFQNEPDFAVASVNYKLDELLARGEEPR